MGRCSNARCQLMEAVRSLLLERGYGGTTIDAICERAGVRKGSFYYFFRSKADLTAAALAEDRERRRGQLAALFDPALPPLERIRRYCTRLVESQLALRREGSPLLGCPLFTLGAEVAVAEPALRAAVAETLAEAVVHLERAIREAQEAGTLPSGAPDERARCLQACIHGLMTQARIADDPELLRPLPDLALQWLGVRSGGV